MLAKIHAVTQSTLLAESPSFNPQMTYTYNKGLVNPKLLGLMLVGASVLLVTTGFQNGMASAYAGRTSGSTRLSEADVDIEEAAEAWNATTMTNQTTNRNKTDIEFLAIQNVHSGSIFQS